MRKSKRIATLAIFVALTAIFNFVPISFGGVSIALMILPLLIVAQIEDFKTTLVAGIILATINIIGWYTIGAAHPLAFAFRNPMVSMFPRVLIGLSTFGVARLAKKLFVRPQFEEKIDSNGNCVRTLMNSKKVVMAENFSTFCATAAGVVTNTLLVGLMTIAFYGGKPFGDGTISIAFLAGLFSINFAIEIVVFSLICPPIVYALRKQLHLG